MSKYIIKNCPNLSHAIMADGTERNFQCGLEIDKYCQDCTDCVMKQIVEKCKRTLSINKGSDNEFTLGKRTFAEFILKDIDIQEVE